MKTLGTNTKREEDLFFAALRQTDARKRSEFLDRHCAGQPALRAHLEQLLAAQADAENFFAEAERAIAMPIGEDQKL